jgi:hypothetical protein
MGVAAQCCGVASMKEKAEVASTKEWRVWWWLDDTDCGDAKSSVGEEAWRREKEAAKDALCLVEVKGSGRKMSNGGGGVHFGRSGRGGRVPAGDCDLDAVAPDDAAVTRRRWG